MNKRTDEKGANAAKDYLKKNPTVSRLLFLQEGRAVAFRYVRLDTRERFFEGWKEAGDAYLFCQDRALAERVAYNLASINRYHMQQVREQQGKDFLRLPGEIDRIKKHADEAWEDMEQLGIDPEQLQIEDGHYVLYEILPSLVEKVSKNNGKH